MQELLEQINPDDEAVFRDVINSMSQESLDKHIQEILEKEAPRIRERQEVRRVRTVITAGTDEIDEANNSRQDQVFVDDDSDFEKAPKKVSTGTKYKNITGETNRINRWSSGTLDGPL